MIDTHCHLLPAVDDGPASLDEAEALARVMHEQGVRTAVCTPHVSRRYPTTRAIAVEALGLLGDRLERAGVPVDVLLGAEIADALAITLTGAELTSWSIAGRYVLIEAVSTTPGPLFETVTGRLGGFGLLPIFAHPERCRAVQRDIRVLDGARRAGALVQVVAPSIVGRWGADVRSTALSLIASGRADLAGSDAHGATRRQCRLREAQTEISARLGPDVWEQLTSVRPRTLLARAPEVGRL